MTCMTHGILLFICFQAALLSLRFSPFFPSLSLRLSLPPLTPTLPLSPIESAAATAQPQSNMPFERYLRPPREPTPSPSQPTPINDHSYAQSQYPFSLGSALDPFPISSSLHFQMPQFLFDGPPTLAHGGGTEVLPAGFRSSKSLTSAWIANTGFAPNYSEDAYVRLR